MNLALTFKKRIIDSDLSIVFYLALLNFFIHLVTNAAGGYGIFRDELYYLACSDNLAAGYVDQPPLSIIILRITKILLGDSLFAIRLIPALCGALTIWLTGLIASRFGGRRVAIFTASLFSFGLAAFAMMGYYSMNSIEILSWAVVFYVLILLFETGNKKYWIILGVVLGLGLLNKIGMLFLGVGIFVGLLLTDHRRWFLTIWPYVAGIIAFVIFLPYVIWNFQHDFAHLEFIRNASEEKYSSLNTVEFLKGQILINNPIAILIWLPGLFALLFSDKLKPFRIFGFIYLTALVILALNKTSKDVYLLPAYAILWAAGGVWVEATISRFKHLRYLFGFVLLIWGVATVALLPVTLPIMPVDSYVEYTKRIGFQVESAENKELGDVHQFYADMFGWQEKVRDVAKVYNSLSDHDKKNCAIYASNYGRCAAIDYYGRKYNLPRAIGDHNNYWIWGPRDCTGEVVIIMGGKLDDHVDDFESVQEAAVSHCDHCMPYENNMSIFLCRNFKGDIPTTWSQQKHYE